MAMYTNLDDEIRFVQEKLASAKANLKKDKSHDALNTVLRLEAELRELLAQKGVRR